VDQLRLLEDLKKMIELQEEVGEDDELISAEEIAQSEVAWQDYRAGHDQGISSKELKLKLFGEKKENQVYVVTAINSRGDVYK